MEHIINIPQENLAMDTPRQNDPIIQLQNVSKTYRNAAGEFIALNHINLAVNQGEFVGIVGRSGSGKSTLMNMITGIDRPTSGAVVVGSAQVNKMSENQIARWRGKSLGIVFQFFQLLPNLTALENVILPMDFCNTYSISERIERGYFLLDKVQMKENAHKLPAALSGGQQQRVAIARALANDPAIIVADEPTGNLDGKSAELMFQVFCDLNQEGKTILMVTHDQNLARQINHSIQIADGEIVNQKESFLVSAQTAYLS